MKNFYKSNILLALVGALIVCLLILDGMLFADEPYLFWLSLPILLLISGLAVGKLMQIIRNVIRTEIDCGGDDRIESNSSRNRVTV